MIVNLWLWPNKATPPVFPRCHRVWSNREVRTDEIQTQFKSNQRSIWREGCLVLWSGLPNIHLKVWIPPHMMSDLRDHSGGCLLNMPINTKTKYLSMFYWHFLSNVPVKSHRHYVKIWIFLRSRLEVWWNFGQPTWSLACEKNMLYMHAIKKFQKGPNIEIQNNFQSMFCFYDSFNSLWVKSLYWCSLWWHLPWKNGLNQTLRQQFLS